MKSDKLIQQLIDCKAIKLCDKDKVKPIIIEHLAEVHKEAVLATIMATNRKNFTEPKYQD